MRLYAPNGAIRNVQVSPINPGVAPRTLGIDEITLYGITANLTIAKSIDGWQTRQNIHTFTEGTIVTNIRELQNGELLVTVREENYQGSGLTVEHIYISSSVITVWTKTLTTSARLGSLWGTSIYDNVILLTTYDENYTNSHAYLSLDYGKTFKTVFQGPVTPYNRFHIHDCEYDPWTGMLWLVCGDEPAGSRYFFSPNWGVNWYDVAEGMTVGYQDTGVLALPDRLLFAPDDGPSAIRQILKNKYNTPKYTHREVENVFVDGGDQQSGVLRVGQMTIAYWASKQNSLVQKYKKPYNLICVFRERPLIVCSGDGVKWYSLVNLRTVFGTDPAECGEILVQRFLGPDKNGKIYLVVRTNAGNVIDPLNHYWFLKADFPSWELI